MNYFKKLFSFCHREETTKSKIIAEKFAEVDLKEDSGVLSLNKEAKVNHYNSLKTEFLKRKKIREHNFAYLECHCDKKTIDMSARSSMLYCMLSHSYYKKINENSKDALINNEIQKRINFEGIQSNISETYCHRSKDKQRKRRKSSEISAEKGKETNSLLENVSNIENAENNEGGGKGSISHLLSLKEEDYITVPVMEEEIVEDDIEQEPSACKDKYTNKLSDNNISYKEEAHGMINREGNSNSTSNSYSRKEVVLETHVDNILAPEEPLLNFESEAIAIAPVMAGNKKQSFYQKSHNRKNSSESFPHLNNNITINALNETVDETIIETRSFLQCNMDQESFNIKRSKSSTSLLYKRESLSLNKENNKSSEINLVNSRDTRSCKPHTRVKKNPEIAPPIRSNTQSQHHKEAQKESIIEEGKEEKGKEPVSPQEIETESDSEEEMLIEINYFSKDQERNIISKIIKNIEACDNKNNKYNILGSKANNKKEHISKVYSLLSKLGFYWTIDSSSKKYLVYYFLHKPSSNSSYQRKVSLDDIVSYKSKQANQKKKDIEERFLNDIIFKISFDKNVFSYYKPDLLEIENFLYDDSLNYFTESSFSSTKSNVRSKERIEKILDIAEDTINHQILDFFKDKYNCLAKEEQVLDKARLTKKNPLKGVLRRKREFWIFIDNN